MGGCSFVQLSNGKSILAKLSAWWKELSDESADNSSKVKIILTIGDNRFELLISSSQGQAIYQVK